MIISVQLTGVLSHFSILKFLTTSAMASFISSRASLIPIQILLPIPNGMKADGKPSGLFSGANLKSKNQSFSLLAEWRYLQRSIVFNVKIKVISYLSGLNSSGSSQTEGSLWQANPEAVIAVPFFTLIPRTSKSSLAILSYL